MYLIVQINSIRNKTIFFFTIPILQSLLSFSQFRISKLIRKKDYLPTGRAKKEKKSILPRIYGVAQLDGLKARGRINKIGEGSRRGEGRGACTRQSAEAFQGATTAPVRGFRARNSSKARGVFVRIHARSRLYLVSRIGNVF